MSKILLNPTDGAVIKNVWYKDVLYFDTNENDIFEVGSVKQFEEDEVANFFKGIYDFLQVVTAEEAAKYLESDDILKCDQCDFTTHVKIALAGHKRKHEKETKLTDLGIPVVKAKRSENPIQLTDTQKSIEQEGVEEGLVGEGLVNDIPRKTIIMS